MHLAGADRVLVLAVGDAGRGAVGAADRPDHHQVVPEHRLRVEAEVRATFDQMSRGLRQMAISVADPATVRAATDGDTAAAGRLMTRASDVAPMNVPGLMSAIEALTMAVNVGEFRERVFDIRPKLLAKELEDIVRL